MLKANIGSVAILLRNTYHIEEFQLSLLSSVFYLIAGVLKVPMGILTDKYGAKKILLPTILCTVIGSLFFAFSTSFTGFLIGRIFMSISYASALLCAVKVISQYFHVRLYAFLVGLVLFLGYLGASFAGGPLSKLTSIYGMQETYILVGVFGVVIFSILAISMESNKSLSSSKSLKDFIIESVQIIKNKQIIYILLYVGLIVAGPICIADLWGKLFLVEIYGVEKSTASYISTTLIYLGIAFGSLIWGTLHSIFVFGKKTLITVSLLMTVCIISIFILPSISLPAMAIISFVIGGLSAIKVVGYEIAKRYVKYENLALVVSLMAMSVTFGSFIIQFGVGSIQHIVEHSFHSNLLMSYSIAVSTLPIIALGTGLLAVKINTNKKSL